MNAPLRAALAFVLAAAACSRPAPTPAPKGPLEKIADRLGNLPPCSSVIPMHWSPSWPVPALEKERLVYRAFFYGRDGNPRDGFAFHQPEGDAVFSPDGTVYSCARRPKPGAPMPRYVPPAGLTLDDVLTRSSDLYVETEAVAALYASGRAPSADERPLIAAYSASFRGLVQPGHESAYLALSPDFWAWVVRNGGAAPAAK